MVRHCSVCHLPGHTSASHKKPTRRNLDFRTKGKGAGRIVYPIRKAAGYSRSKAGEGEYKREPWQLTFAEWHKRPHSPRDVRFHGEQFHHDWVADRLKKGLPVPRRVVAPYPDLKARAQAG